jgi:hypothetical protein
MNYFYAENSQQRGPYTLDELRQQAIHPGTLIWHEGLTEWTEAKNLRELADHFQKTTPPKIPVEATVPPQRETANTATTTVNKKDKQSSSSLRILAIGAVLIGIVYIVGTQITRNQNDSGSDIESNYDNGGITPVDQQYDRPRETKQLSEKEIRNKLQSKENSNPARYLTASGNYRVNLASNTIIEGTIYNSASIAGYKNIELTAQFYSKTDVLLGEDSFLIMDFIAPNGTLRFKEKISGWWENIDHWTLTITSAEPY